MKSMKCKDCKFWEFVRQLGRTPDKDSKEYNKMVGYCHKRSSVLVDGIKRWPEMVEDEWCSEYEEGVYSSEHDMPEDIPPMSSVKEPRQEQESIVSEVLGLLREIKTAAGKSQRDVYFFLKADKAIELLEKGGG